MVLVSHKYKFIYIKNNKVAGSSVESFFGRYCLPENASYSYSDKIATKITKEGIIGSRLQKKKDNWYNHKPAVDIKRDLGDKVFNKYYKFCVVRNPYDKMVSNYFWKKHQIKNKQSFKEFCQTTDVNDINVHCINGKSVCDFFIRYENLENDIKNVCLKLGIKDFDISDLPNHKSSFRDKRKHYREYYDEETKKIVFDKHKLEFKMFNYSF